MPVSLPDDRKHHQMPDGRRVVLEGLTGNHYQMTGSTNESPLASSCWDVGQSARCWNGSRCLELSPLWCSYGLQVVKFFYLMGSNFLTTGQIFLPPHQTPQNAPKWPYKANLHHLAYTSKKPFQFLFFFL